MRFPWVSGRAYANLLTAIDRCDEQIVDLKKELEKEREANRNLVASALALRNLGNPYRPSNMTAPPKPVGRASAAARIRELEEIDRQKAKELNDGIAAATPADAAAAN